MADLAKIVEDLSALTVLEAAELSKMLEEKWGVSAAAPVAVAAAAAGAAPAEAVEEKTEFDVVLTDAGAQKINVIKEVRAITGLGLKEAKDLVEGAPKPVKEGVNKDEADKIKAQLDAWNAQIDKMQAEAKKAPADSRIRYEEQIKEMRQRRDEAEDKMREARAASENAWDDMSNSFVDAWKIINEGFQNATKRFK